MLARAALEVLDQFHPDPHPTKPTKLYWLTITSSTSEMSISLVLQPFLQVSSLVLPSQDVWTPWSHAPSSGLRLDVQSRVCGLISLCVFQLNSPLSSGSVIYGLRSRAAACPSASVRPLSYECLFLWEEFFHFIWLSVVALARPAQHGACLSGSPFILLERKIMT